MTKNNSAVATIEDTDFAIMKSESKEAVEAVQDNLRGAILSRFDLVKVKVPGAGATEWTIEEAEGNKLVKSFEGIILHWHDARAYYEPRIDPKTGKEVDSLTDDPPDCASEDAIYGEPLGSCAECEKSKWGTGKGGKGQACRLKRVMYVLQQESYLPVVLEAPPTSYGSIKDYYMSLSKNGISTAAIVTEFSLISDQSSDGFKYAKIVPKSVRKLTPDEKAFVKNYADTFKKALS